jgi:hypothetical protein
MYFHIYVYRRGEKKKRPPENHAPSVNGMVVKRDRKHTQRGARVCATKDNTLPFQRHTKCAQVLAHMHTHTLTLMHTCSTYRDLPNALLCEFGCLSTFLGVHLIPVNVLEFGEIVN